MKAIVAYHPVFVVESKGKKVMVEVDLNDWYDDREVLDSLFQASGYRSWGDLVTVLREGPLTLGSYGVLAVRIKEGEPAVGSPSMGWSESIG